MPCGCSKRRQTGGQVLGYYAVLPDGTEIPNVSGGAQPFMSPIEARIEVRRAGGGTIRMVKNPP